MSDARQDGNRRRGESLTQPGRDSTNVKHVPRSILRNSFAAPNEAPAHPLLPQRSRPDTDPVAVPAVFQGTGPSRATAYPRVSDTEADRLARACGDGPFSPTSPNPLLETSAYTGTTPPVQRTRSQSMSDKRCRRRFSDAHTQDRRRSVRRVEAFPHPPTGHTLRALKRILNEDTKGYKIHDYIEVEDLLSGKLWDDEDELPVDCVRDRVDDDSGHDGVWRRERRARRMRERLQRELHRKEGSKSHPSQFYRESLTTIRRVRVILARFA